MGEQNGTVEPEVLAVQRFDGPPPSTQHILALAVQKGADVGVLEKLMDLQERWEANEAKKLYVQAMTAFKQKCPAVLPKDGVVDFTSSKGRTHYTHATLGGIVTKVTALMGEHGLSVAWSTGQQNGGVTVTCHITHEAGHSESVTLSGPPDDSGNKNRIQQVGSTVTYLQRYTLLSALGLATADQDDDGICANGYAVIHVTPYQVEEITGHCKRLGIKKDDWAPAALNLFPAGVKSLRDMSEAQAATLIKRLSAAKSKVDLKKTAPKAQADPLLSGKAPTQKTQTPEEALGIDEDELEPAADTDGEQTGQGSGGPEPYRNARGNGVASPGPVRFAETRKPKGQLDHVCPGCGCSEVKMGKGAFSYVCTSCGQEFKD